MRVHHRFDVAHMRFVERIFGAEERRRLQRDAVPPALARLSEDGPANARLRSDAVDMSADGGCAMGVSAAEGEIHASADVLCAPPSPSVGLNSIERAGE